MSKHTAHNTEEDLWHWAERRDTPTAAKAAMAPVGAPTASNGIRPTGTVVRRWISMLGFARNKRS